MGVKGKMAEDETGDRQIIVNCIRRESNTTDKR